MSDSDLPKFTVPDPPEDRVPYNAPRAIRARIVLCGLILAAAAVGLLVTIERGHADAAMIFVGLPTLLALACALAPPARSVHGVVFKGVSIALLLAAVMLHEGAICVVFAAPLVFGVAHGVAAIVEHDRRRAFAIAPIALALGIEGLAPGLRVAPDQTVTVTHTVAMSVAEVEARLAAGPAGGVSPASLLLKVMPLPAHIGGAGLNPGDRWTFHFGGDSHGAGGVLITELVGRESTSDGGNVQFHTVSDTSIVSRWLDWSDARLEWRANGALTDVTLTLSFTRGLDPSWYFGPLQHYLVGASADYLLDAMGLPE